MSPVWNQPSRDRLGRRVVALPVAAHHERAAHGDLARLAVRHVVAVVVHQAELGAADRHADRARLALAVGQVERAHPGRLRQPVALEHLRRRTPRRTRAAPRPASPSRRTRRGRARRCRSRSRSGWCSSAVYMVGTPANVVTLSRWMISSALAGSKRGSSVSSPRARTETFITEFIPNTWNSGSVASVDRLRPGVDQVARRLRARRQVGVRERRALRRPGRARRVDDHRRVVVRAVGDVLDRLGLAERLLELAGRDEDAARRPPPRSRPARARRTRARRPAPWRRSPSGGSRPRAP